MPDTPLTDASKLPANELSIEGGASQGEGKEARLRLQRESQKRAGGVVAEITEKKGWKVWGFFKRKW